MHEALLLLHNWLRWLVLALAFWALFSPSVRALAAYAHTLALQVVLGLALAFVSPLVLGSLNALDQIQAFMAAPEVRFFLAEHWVTALLALGLAHMALARFRKGGETRWLLFLSLAFLLLTVPWFRPLLRF